MGKSEHLLTVDDTHGTPEEILSVITKTFGPIGFDPCSHPNAIVPCELAIMLPCISLVRCKFCGWSTSVMHMPGATGIEKCGQKGCDSAEFLLTTSTPPPSPTAKHTEYGDGLSFCWDGLGLGYQNPPYSDLEAWCEKAAREGDENVMLVPVRTGNVFWPKGAGLADVECRLRRVTHRGSKTHAPFAQWLLVYTKRVELAVLGLSELGDVRVHPRHMTLRPDPATRWRKT